jgi:hypothetical protein
MKSRYTSRNQKRIFARQISEVIRTKKEFVVILNRPFYINDGYLASPFPNDLIYISNYLSKNDYFKFFKQFTTNSSEINIVELFERFMKDKFSKNPKKYVVKFR